MNLLLFLCGIIMGMVSGLIPGLHINLIGSILPIKNIEFLISMSVAYSFFNTFPLFLLQFPDESNFLMLNIVQKLIVLKRVNQGLKYTIFGSLFGSVSALFFGILVYAFNLSFLKHFTVIILFILFLILLRYDLILGLLYSFFGILLLSLDLKQPLFHFFSLGFALYNYFHLSNSEEKIKTKRKNQFNLSALNDETIKNQLNKLKNPNVLTDFSSIDLSSEENFNSFKNIKTLSLMFLSSFLSFLFLFYPGISASLSILIMMAISKRLLNYYDQIRMYLYYIGISNSTAYVIGNFLIKYNIGRNYIALILKESHINYTLLDLLIISSLAIFVSFILSLFMLKSITKLIKKLNLSLLNLLILLITIIISYIFDSLFGILVGLGSYILLRLTIIKSKPRFLMMLAIISKVLIYKLVT